MKRTKRRVNVALGILICGGLLASTSPAVAQEEGDDVIDLNPVPRDQVVGPFKIDDGSYAGVIGQSVSMFRSEGPVTLWMHRDSSGSAAFEVADGSMAGTWDLSGSGGLTAIGFPGVAEGDSIDTASGTLSGSFPYVLAGAFDSAVSATVSGPLGLGASDSGGGTIELSFELGESVQVCGQVLGNWDQSFYDFFASNDWDPYVKTHLVAFSDIDDEEILERLEAIVETTTSATTKLEDPELSLILMVDALDEIEQLMSDIKSYPDTCQLEPEFLRVANQAIRDMLNTLLDHWQTYNEDFSLILLRRLVEVGLRAGVLGSGATDPGSAEFLEARIKVFLQQKYDQIAGGDFDGAVQALVIGQMLGYELSTEVSNRDVCLALGGC